MTRGNLNFIWQNPGESPRTLFHYHNGDQYPEGLLCFFGLEKFLAIERPWTPEHFRAWIRENYRVAGRAVTTLPNGLTVDMHRDTETPAEPEDLGESGQPRIYYTDGFTTDYSYVFKVGLGERRRPTNTVTVWNWDKRIFAGSARRFLSFCRKRAAKKGMTALPHQTELGVMDAVLSAFRGDAGS